MKRPRARLCVSGACFRHNRDRALVARGQVHRAAAAGEKHGNSGRHCAKIPRCVSQFIVAIPPVDAQCAVRHRQGRNPSNIPGTFPVGVQRRAKEQRAAVDSRSGERAALNRRCEQAAWPRWYGRCGSLSYWTDCNARRACSVGYGHNATRGGWKPRGPRAAGRQQASTPARRAGRQQRQQASNPAVLVVMERGRKKRIKAV